jgi:predicted dehydrogenase
MTTIGIAGVGFMGMIHYLAYQKVGGAKIAALCDEREHRLAGDWRDIKGNFGPPGQRMDLGDIGRYKRLEELIADPKIDVIDVCLPPGLHAQVTVDALKAGKHVFCEKPIALSTDDANRMVQAAKDSGKLLMIGHVLPFFPEYRFAREAIADGRYGKVLGGHFKRVISDPLWLPDFYNPATTGGPMIDLHIHDAHFIRVILGMPRSVHTIGRMRGQVAELFQSQFLFDDPSQFASATSGAIQQQGRPFTHAYEIYLERATLLFDFAAMADNKPWLEPVTVLTHDGKVERPELGAGDPIDSFAGEIAEVISCVQSGKPSALLDGGLARDALVLGQKQTQSLVERRVVEV